MAPPVALKAEVSLVVLMELMSRIPSRVSALELIRDQPPPPPSDCRIAAADRSPDVAIVLPLVDVKLMDPAEADALSLAALYSAPK